MSELIRVVTESFLPPERWMQEGACTQSDPDAWFAEQDETDLTRQAKRVCRTVCPVREQCLEYALRSGEQSGVWGGFTAMELRQIRHGRRVA